MLIRIPIVVMVLSLFAAPVVTLADATSTLSNSNATRHGAPEPDALTLHQLITLTQRDNKDLLAARYAIEIGRARLVQAGALPNPRLDLAVRSDFLFKNEGEYGRSIGISQQFPIAGRLLRQKDVARVDIALAQAEVAEAERRLAGEVAADAYRLLMVDRQIQVRDELIAAEQKLAKSTRERFKAAEVSELDVNAVQLDLQRLAQERALLQSQRWSLQAALNTRLGRPATTSLMINEPLPEVDTLPVLEQLQARALSTRPDLHSALLSGDRARAEMALARAQRWEDWSVGVALSEDKLVINGAPPQGTGRAIGLSLSIPLPLFNKNQGLIAEAEASSNQAVARSEALRLGIINEVASTYAEASKLQQQLLQYQQAIFPVGQRDVQLAQKGYGQGLVTILEVMQAQRQQADLKLAYLSTLDQFLQSLVRLHTAAGDYIPLVPADPGTNKEDY